MLTIQNLTKEYRVLQKEPGLKGSLKSLFWRDFATKKAVSNVSFEIGEGEIVGLVGANGAGKTTIIKMLSGILFPSSGKAQVLGFTPWDRKKEFRRQIALIMGQKAQLWWDLTASDCFSLLKEIYEIPKENFDKTLRYLIEILEIGHELKTPIRKLSLGERMKMELIATLLHSPKVVFLDEPTIGLDFNAQRSIRKFLLEYMQNFRPAMILTSHYMEDIESLCKRLLILKNGSIAYDGPIQQIRDRFQKTKILKVTTEQEKPSLEKLRGIGEATKIDGGFTLKVDTKKIPEAMAQILQSYSVKDLEVEEEDIALVISSMMR